MRKIFITVLLALGLHGGVVAAGAGYAWDQFPMRKLTDQASIQNGAKLFVNYCLNCHSAAYMRYNRLRDIGLSEDQIKRNLLFSDAKIGETMKVALDASSAKDWFGANPPDLTVIARSRSDISKGSGADYLYTYLRTFYRDDTRLTGWNNLAYPDVAMPHVMWELQGQRRARFVEENDPANPGKTLRRFEGFEQVTPGTQSALEFDDNMADLVAFLVWMAEPARATRIRLGVWVVFFLSILTFFVWRLNKAYWRDVK